MAADIKTKYGATATAITITFTSMASSQTVGRQSTEIDNTTNLFLDALVSVKTTWPTAGTIANDKTVYVYAWGITDSTTPIRPGEIISATTNSTIGASDAAYTINAAGTPLTLIGSIPIPTLNTSANGIVVSNPMSVAAAFGGSLPAFWGIVIINFSGVTLHSAGCSAWYQGVLAQTV
jgi:hypothetical protein